MSTQPGAPARTRVAVSTIVALAGLGLLAGCRAGGSAAAPAATLSASAVAILAGTRAPASLLADATNDLLFAGSVQARITISGPGGAGTEVTDASVSSGRQVVTLSLRSAGGGAPVTAKVIILLIHNISYVDGNEAALNGVFGLPADQAGPLAGQWIAVRPGEKLGQDDYTEVSSGLTLNSLAAGLALNGKLTSTAPGIVGGQPARGVQGNYDGGSGQARLYVTDSDAPLPVTFSVPGGQAPFQMSFRHWGEAVHLTAPSDAVPASSVTPDSTTT